MRLTAPSAGAASPIKEGAGSCGGAAGEAAMLRRSSSWLKPDYHRIAAPRGKKIATVAVGRKMLMLVFHGEPSVRRRSFVASLSRPLSRPTAKDG